MITHIVARSKNNVIGMNNKLPWHIPEDLKWFKYNTLNKRCIVGKTTFDGMPKLKDRDFVVVSTTGTSLDTAIKESIRDMSENDEIFIIGGASIYTQSFKYVDRLLVTQIHEEVDGDTYYDIPPGFKLLSKSIDYTYKNFNYHFEEYIRTI